MKIKKAVSCLLSLMMVFAMIPSLGAVVYADDATGSPAISLGAGNIEKGNKVYMGIKQVNETGTPISWLVLGDANSQDLKDGDTVFDASDARLLITEKTWGGLQFDPDGQSNTWQGSNIQNWCTEFLTGEDGNNYSGWKDRFSALEETTVLKTSKTDAEFDGQWGTSSLENEQLFLLSAEEVSDDYGYFSGDDSRIAYQHDKDETWDWWLRSPDRSDSGYAARVTPSGAVVDYGVFSRIGARPAFNFNLNSVLFTSAAAGGKTSGTVGADALTAVSDVTTNEWKLTLKDSDRSSFTASAAEHATLVKDEDYSGWSVPVVYSNANTGDNEYVSAILCDSSGQAIYYGNIANNSAASSNAGQSVSIPDGLKAGRYTLNIFNEQVNGDKRTDYASAFSTIELRVKRYYHVNFYYDENSKPVINPPDFAKEVHEDDTVTPPEPEREGYTLLGWRDVSSSDNGYFDFSQGITADHDLVAVWLKNGSIQSEPPAPSASSAPVSIKDAKVVLSKTTFTYNGKAQKPAIMTIGGNELVAETDYTAVWSKASPKNVGKYTVTVTGKGGYTGTTKATYKIIPKGTKLKSLKKARKAVKVRWSRQSARMSKSRINGYQIQLATDSEFTQNKKTVTVKGYKKTSKKVTKLKGGQTYYARIRTYKTVKGKKYYSKWSKARTVTTR